MKNPERVAELLAELRALSETDFEHHRIDVLERDLSAPPTVEVIDDTHQRFDGVTYHKNQGGHFVSGNGIHRAVWQYYFSEIPEGDYVIHHIDADKSNNDISNLQCLSNSDHMKIHSNETIAKYEVSKLVLCKECGTPFAPKKFGTHFFCSAKCNAAWHRRTGTYNVVKQCAYCGKSFESYKHAGNIYCSPSCAAQSRQKPLMIKTCPVCGKAFTSPKKNQKCCSLSCAAKLGNQGKRKKPKICPVCGKSFTSKSLKRIYCSRSCAMHINNQKRAKPPTEKICPVCGKSFVTKSPSQIYCSHSCAAKCNNQKRKQSQAIDTV